MLFQKETQTPKAKEGVHNNNIPAVFGTRTIYANSFELSKQCIFAIQLPQRQFNKLNHVLQTQGQRMRCDEHLVQPIPLCSLGTRADQITKCYKYVFT